MPITRGTFAGLTRFGSVSIDTVGALGTLALVGFVGGVVGAAGFKGAFLTDTTFRTVDGEVSVRRMRRTGGTGDTALVAERRRIGQGLSVGTGRLDAVFAPARVIGIGLIGPAGGSNRRGVTGNTAVTEVVRVSVLVGVANLRGAARVVLAAF